MLTEGMTIIVAAKNLDGIIAGYDTLCFNLFDKEPVGYDHKVRSLVNGNVIIGMSGLLLGLNKPQNEFAEWDIALRDAAYKQPLEWLVKKVYLNSLPKRINRFLDKKRKERVNGIGFYEPHETYLNLRYLIGFVDGENNYRLFTSCKVLAEPNITEVDCAIIGTAYPEVEEFLRVNYRLDMNIGQLKKLVIDAIEFAKRIDSQLNPERILKGLGIGRLNREGYKLLQFSNE